MTDTAIHGAVVPHERMLRESLEAHKRLASLTLSSGRLDSIVKAVSQLVGKPVLFEDNSFGLISCAFASHDPFQERAVRLRLSQDTIKKLLAHPVVAEVTAGSSASARLVRTRVNKVNLDGLGQLVIPVTNGRALFGWLSELLLGEESREIDCVALEYGSTMLAFKFAMEKTRLETLGQVKRDFLEEILNDGISEKDLLSEARLLELDLTPPGIVVVVGLPERLSKDYHSEVENLIRLSTSPTSSSIRLKDRIVLFHHSDSATGAESQVARLIETAARFLREYTPGLAVGISRCYQNTSEIRARYDEAEQAMQVARVCGKNVLSFSELGFHRVLALAKDRAQLAGFSQDLLGKLCAYDARHASCLVLTLETYLESGCRITETARQMHLHINSLRYRLQRIEDVLGVNLSDVETQLLLHLALRIRSYMRDNKH